MKKGESHIIDILLLIVNILLGVLTLHQFSQLFILSDELGLNYEKNFFNQNGIWLSMLFCILSLGVLLFGFIKEGSSGQPNTPKFIVIKTFIVIFFLAFAAFINYNVYNQRLNYDVNDQHNSSFTSVNLTEKIP